MVLETLIQQMVARAEELVISQERVQQLIAAQERVRQLMSANRDVNPLPLVLQRIVESARDLVGARYAALGVIGADGMLEQFLHVGLDGETVATMGELPKGHGLLGALIEDPHPLRLARLSDDERSCGFPPAHPPMEGLLAVPIRAGDDIFGNLYLTERQGGPFTAEDEELLTAFAVNAGIAVDNTRLYEEARRRQQWLKASAEISELLLAPQPGRDPLQVIVESVRRLADADIVTLVIPSRQLDTLEVAVAAGHGEERLRGIHYSARDSLVSLAVETGRGVRVGVVDDKHRYPVHLTRAGPVGPAMAVPLSGRHGPQGAIVAGRLRGRRAFTTADLEMTEAFSRHAAIARELADARGHQQRLALLEDRDRIARDLHDHVIQRLFAAGLTLQSMAVGSRESQVTTRLSRIVEDIDVTIRQIRTSIFQLGEDDDAPPGVRTTVLEIVHQITPVLGFEPETRFGGPLDTVIPTTALSSIGAVVREAVTNVAKHAHATKCAVELSVDGDHLLVEVSDNGIGLGDTQRRSGLDNLTRRAEIWGGSLTLTPNEPHGMRFQWTIPLPQ